MNSRKSNAHLRQASIKNRQDHRYMAAQNRLENAIGRLIKHGIIARLNVPILSHEANIWRSTFYDHFKHIDEAIDQFYHKMRPELQKLASELELANCSLEIIFSKILYFIATHHAYYNVMVCRKNPVAIIEITEIFHRPICKHWSNYGNENHKQCFCFFAWEMSGIICYWGCTEKFSQTKIPKYAKRLAKLAYNVPQRLSL